MVGFLSILGSVPLGAQTCENENWYITGSVTLIPPPPGQYGTSVVPYLNGNVWQGAIGCRKADCTPATGSGICKVGALTVGSFEFGAYQGGTVVKSAGGSCIFDPPSPPLGENLKCSGSFSLTIYPDFVRTVPPKPICRHCPNNGDPVNIVSGNAWFSHTDISLPGAPGVDFVRSYNSIHGIGGRGGAFGLGWFHSYERAVDFPAANVLRVREPEGTALYFWDENGDGLWEPMVPVTEKSTVQASGTGYVRNMKSGAAESYDLSGQLLSLTDEAGRTTAFQRDGQGRLTSITGAGGRGVSLTYNAASKVETLTGPAGLVAFYSYDTANRLESVAYADGTGLRFGYDNFSQILSVTDFAGHVVERHEYSGGRALTSERADGQFKYTFNYVDSNKTIVTDGLGNQTTYTWYDFKGSPQMIKIEGFCSDCGGGGDVQNSTYDVNGRISSHTNGSGTTIYTYYPDGELQSETDGLGRTTSYTYDSKGRVLTRTDPGGHVTTTVYDNNGPTSITETVTASVNRATGISYNGQGLPATITDPRSKVTTLGYNGFGELTSVTDPLSHATTFGYDAMGRRTTVTDALSHTTTTAYDARDRVTRITNHDGTFTSFAYDSSGRRTQVRDPLGRTTFYVYDSTGRLESVIDPMNGVTRYGYDAMSRMTSLKDANGNTTAFEYDAFSRVKKVIYPGGAFETFTYDTAGRLQTKTDRKAVTTTYGYDTIGRLTGKTYSDGTTPAVSYTYNTAGLLATAANGTDTLTWVYDLAGQLTSEQSSKNASTVAYTYDLAGNRLTLSLDGTLFVSYGYDDASRLTSITRGSNVFGFGYDNANRRTSMTYPNGVNTSYSYDNLNRLLNLSATKASTTITNFTYSYDAAGNRLTKQQPDYTETYGYDPLYRLTQAERTGSLTGLQTWSYDAVGNRLTNQQDGAVTTSAYNNKNQLTSSTGGGLMLWRGSLNEPGTVSFTTATVNGKPARMLPGNVFEALLPVTTGSNTVTLEAKDTTGNVATKAYSVTVAGNGASQTFDANGNLAQKVEGANTWVYQWNAESELVKVQKNSAEIASFKYDPLGRRVEKAASSGTIAYVYESADILRATAGTGSTVFVHGPGLDEPLARDLAGAISFPHTDALGSLVARTDSTGGVEGTLRYGAWGQLEQGSPDVYAFAGREWDAETGLAFHRRRYYDPMLGRFLGEDPAGFADGLNLYPYVGSNPALYVDAGGTLRHDVDLNPTIRTAGWPNVRTICKNPAAMGCMLLNVTTKCDCVCNEDKQWQRTITTTASNPQIVVATNATSPIYKLLAHEGVHVDLHKQNFADLKKLAEDWEKKLFPDKGSCQQACQPWVPSALRVLRRGHFWHDLLEKIFSF